MPIAGNDLMPYLQEAEACRVILADASPFLIKIQ
jgi:hypothetical protein